ncbi:MAG TPA: hypothetical protein VFO83_14485, partial [Aggregicoccus sp.]|nr:hypothetical protein [Aggregicoccus sp.]
MWTPSARVSLLAAALALLPACGNDHTRLPVQLVTRSCSGTPPLEGATHLRLQVTGEGMAPRQLLVPVDDVPEALEQVQTGPGRVLEVRAYQRRPEQGGRVVALGRSLPFELAKEGAPTVRVVLRRTNAFTPVSDAAQPEACGALAEA